AVARRSSARLRLSRRSSIWVGRRSGGPGWRRLRRARLSRGRAKWGAGGPLHRQSALAGPNSRAEGRSLAWPRLTALKVGTCAAWVSEPRQVRKEAAVRREPGGAACIRAGAVNRGANWGTSIEAGVRGHKFVYA